MLLSYIITLHFLFVNHFLIQNLFTIYFLMFLTGLAHWRPKPSRILRSMTFDRICSITPGTSKARKPRCARYSEAPGPILPTKMASQSDSRSSTESKPFSVCSPLMQGGWTRRCSEKIYPSGSRSTIWYSSAWPKCLYTVSPSFVAKAILCVIILSLSTIGLSLPFSMTRCLVP